MGEERSLEKAVERLRTACEGGDAYPDAPELPIPSEAFWDDLRKLIEAHDQHGQSLLELARIAIEREGELAAARAAHQEVCRKLGRKGIAIPTFGPLASGKK